MEAIGIGIIPGNYYLGSYKCSALMGRPHHKRGKMVQPGNLVTMRILLDWVYKCDRCFGKGIVRVWGRDLQS